MTRVLIAGVSTRGCAESAARAGYEVVAVDGFGDLDLRARAAVVALARGAGGFSASAAVAAARRLRCDAVCYVASFENHPRAVAALARRGALWGNSPEVLARVRDPASVARALAARGLATPVTLLKPPPAGSRLTWLLKPRASGGGRGILVWRGGRRAPRGSYWQQRIAGVPGSIVFAADGRRAVPLGLSLLLAGDAAFGAAGLRYCGNILCRPAPRVRATAARLAAAITEAFGLVGVNGLDFVVAGGVPYPVEVNPRYTASMELVERATGASIFEIHARACAGTLPPRALAVAAWRGAAVGKAVLYARRDVVVDATAAWLEDDDIRDVPAPGERIARGRPICTIFARGPSPAACRRALVARARALYASVDARQARIA